MAKKDQTLVDCTIAAAEIGVKPMTLATWTAMKIGPKHVRVGSEIYYRMADLKKFIASRNKKEKEAM